jgi:hypothetical protein
MADPRLIKEAARVSVGSAGAPLNLVTETSDRLAGEGLPVIRSNAPQVGELTSTRVVVYGDKPRTVDTIVRALGLAERDVVQARGDESDADVQVLLGRDFTLPPLR